MRAPDRASLGLEGVTLGSAALLAFAFVLVAQLDAFFAIPPGGTPVLSLAKGLVLSFLLVSRRDRWWVYLLGFLVACAGVDFQRGVGLPVALIHATAKAAELALVAFLVRRHLGPRSPTDSFDGMLCLFAGAIIGGALDASIRTFAAVLSVPGFASDFHTHWLTWFLAETFGLAVVSAFLLGWFGQGLDWLRQWPPRRYVEAAALLVAALFQNQLFENTVGLRATGFEALYLTFPLIIWAAVRFELPGATAVALAASFNAVGLTQAAGGPFAGVSAAETALSLQFFLVVVIGTALALGAAMRERRAAQAALKNAHSRQERDIAELQATRAELENQSARLAAMAEGFAQETAEAKAANGAKSAFLATMSHELRTPMVGILGLTDLLLGSGLNETQQHYVATIRRSGRSLLEITEDVLDFAKIEAGRLELVERDFQLVPVIDGVTELLGSTAHLKGIALAAFVAPDVPRQIRGDANRLRQVLINLVGNAIKFTESGGVALAAAVQRPAGGGPLGLRITVADTGIGIADEDRAGLFERFSQVETVQDGRPSGTGLGLAICHQLVELMGGEIGVETEPGRGSTFWLSLPLADGLLDRVAPPATPDWLKRALVVDGNVVTRNLWQRHLEALGAQAVVAPDAEAAAEALARIPTPDLIVVDEELPAADQQRLVDLAKDAEEAPRLWQAAFMRGGRLAEPAGDLPFDATVAKPLRHQSLEWCLEGAAAGAAREPGVAPTLSAEEAIPAGGVERSDTPRVLLVEDDQVNQMLGFAILSAAGYRVDLAGNGAEGVEAARLTRYDAILMDVRMPVMDGQEATRAIRALGGWWQRVPIIAMTADAMPDDRNRCLGSGMDDYIAKPVERDELLEKVAAWADGGKEGAKRDGGALAAS